MNVNLHPETKTLSAKFFLFTEKRTKKCKKTKAIKKEKKKEITSKRENRNRQTVNKPSGTDRLQHLRLLSSVGRQAGWQVSEGFNTDRSDAVFRPLNVIVSALFKRTTWLALASKPERKLQALSKKCISKRRFNVLW